MYKHVLLTRAEADNLPLQAALEAQGISTTLAPLSEVAQRPFTPFSDALNALILTSRHAAFAIENLPKTLPVFCIGEATATSIHTLGFWNIYDAQGNMQSLMALVRDTLPAKAMLGYPRGEVVQHQLKKLLHEYRVQERVVYSVKPLELRLSPNGVTGVALFSANHAKRVIAALGSTEGLTAYCFSKAIASEVADAGFLHVVISASQTQQAMLEAIVHDR